MHIKHNLETRGQRDLLPPSSPTQRNMQHKVDIEIKNKQTFFRPPPQFHAREGRNKPKGLGALRASRSSPTNELEREGGKEVEGRW